MIRLFQLLVAITLALPGAAWADMPAMPFGEGRLFRIEKPGHQPSYLFGTMHVADREILDLPDPVLDAFDGARQVALEIVWDGTAAEYMGTVVRLPAGETLVEMIGPELYASVLERTRGLGLDPEQLQELRPWAVGMLLGAGSGGVRSGLEGGRYLDDWLRHEAGADGKLVYGLESPSEHFAAFDQLSDAQERQMLASALNEIRVDEFYEQMKAMYLAGDLAGLSATMGAGETEGARDLSAALKRHLIVERNRNMVARMEKLLAKADTFAAVGALHLPGEDGMLRLLEARGYTVTRVY